MLKYASFLAALSAPLAAWAAPNILPADTATTHYIAEQVATTDGLKLNAQLAIPAGRKGPFPAVLLLVGSGPGNRYEDVPGFVTADGKPALLFKGIEGALVRQGIAVFTYDKRGVSPKDATFTENTVDSAIFGNTADAEHLASDALQAFDALGSLPEVDSSRVGVLGHSEGTALGMKVAEKRPKVRALYMLGLWTRNFQDILRFQMIDSNVRSFSVVDANQDGKISESEYAPFHAEAPGNFPDWSSLASLDTDHDGQLSLAELRTMFETGAEAGLKKIQDRSSPWKDGKPRDWYLQYFAEGSYLERRAAFCSITHVFQGEIDMQTPFADALALRDRCVAQGTPLASFSSYANEGHGFSPRTGLRGWNDTIGPMDPQVPLDIAREAAKDLIAR